jgi:GMP synthase (glutamine-hydrolysing)
MPVTLTDDVEDADHIVISGSHQNNPRNEKLLTLLKKNSELPILGICYGAQLIAHSHGYKLFTNNEYGPIWICLSKDSCFAELPEKIRVLMSHANAVDIDEKHVIARTLDGGTAAFKIGKQIGLLFHPEVYDTDFGEQILSNIIGCKPQTKNWSAFLNKKREEITTLPDSPIMALSGGVDSLVCFKLVSQIRNDIKAFYIDMGIAPKHFVERALDVGAEIVDKRQEFLAAIQNVTDGKVKRRVVGKLFANTLSSLSKKSPLIQGTIASDIVESGDKKRDSIKEHHNVGAMPKLDIFIYEPLSELYKDEVRELGSYLEVSREYLNVRPFPGPGFTCRIIGEITKERLELLGNLTEVVDTMTQDLELWQIPVILVPIPTTNVRGDKAVLAPYLVVLRPVKSRDGMTATWGKAILEKIDLISHELSKHSEVGRVLLEVDNKPPSTIEWL